MANSQIGLPQPASPAVLVDAYGVAYGATTRARERVIVAGQSVGDDVLPVAARPDPAAYALPVRLAGDDVDLLEALVAAAGAPGDAAGVASAIGLLKSLAAQLAGSLAVSGWVSVANLPATQPVSGPLTDTQLRASAVPVSGAFYPATQPVSLSTSALSPASPTSATVGTSSAQIVAADAATKFVELTNTHATNWIYLAFGATAVVGSGVALAPGGGSWSPPPGFTVTSAVNAIASGASTNVAVQRYT